MVAVTVVAVGGAGTSYAQSSLPGSSVGSEGTRCVVALDPGHNGADTDEFDPVTGVRMIDYPNELEDADALQVARAVESRLNLVGIGTVLLKSSVEEDVTYRERVDRAAGAGAFMGVSIHTTPGPNQSAIFPQREGGFRSGLGEAGTPHTVTFDNPRAAAESQRLSGVVAGARSLVEGSQVPVRDNSFNGREPLWEGNIPVISLIADTPWIYNEFGSATGGGAHGLTGAEKSRYIDGLSAGLIAAAATSPACTGIGS
ncbi:N-acetylmuramoyl-L-alanine amidase [Corynebacterium sp. USCH3]|uniref:N-acetylmuramoyl-L-alanine amidase n=1 Tax=Corynebacterium sp. USCH3 TaxID=3024840 RepID=UPI0030A8EAE7